MANKRILIGGGLILAGIIIYLLARPEKKINIGEIIVA